MSNVGDNDFEWDQMAANGEWDRLEISVKHREVFGGGYELTERLATVCENDLATAPNSCTGAILEMGLVFALQEHKFSRDIYIEMLHQFCRFSNNQGMKAVLDWMITHYSDEFHISSKIVATDYDGMNTFDSVWSDYFANRSSFPHNVSSLFSDGKQVSQMNQKELRLNFRQILRKTDTLLSAMVEQQYLPKQELHRIAMSPSPGIATWVALQLYPFQVTEKDCSGNLPLHLAVSKSATNHLHAHLEDDYKTIVPLLQDANRPALQILLEAYPQAARIADGNGRFALHLAIENYGDWKKRHDTRWEKRKREMRFEPQIDIHMDDMILDLVKTCPNVLGVRDTKTHLYPFLLAAEECSLGVVYTLLRLKPDILQNLPSTTYAEYLEDKNALIVKERNELQVSLEQVKQERDHLLSIIQNVDHLICDQK